MNWNENELLLLLLLSPAAFPSSVLCERRASLSSLCPLWMIVARAHAMATLFALFAVVVVVVILSIGHLTCSWCSHARKSAPLHVVHTNTIKMQIKRHCSVCVQSIDENWQTNNVSNRQKEGKNVRFLIRFARPNSKLRTEKSME